MLNQKEISLPKILKFRKEKPKHLLDPKNLIDSLEKKNPDESSKSKGNHCFICKKKGHFARNCPNRPAKSVWLIEHLQDSMLLSESDDVKSFFSEQDEYNEQTAFILAETEDHYESENVSVIQTVKQI